MEPSAPKPNAIEKAMDILQAFVPENAEMGTLQISKKLGLHKATASRILLILVQQKFLYQNPETKKFTLGPMALQLGRAVAQSLQNEIVTIAKPHIDKLRSALDETVALEQLVGSSTMLVYIAEGQMRHRMAGGVGARIPVNAAAGAKAILAHSDPGFVHRLVGDLSRFESLTPNTITDPEKLLAQLREIRADGYSFDCEEIDIGINALGVPIFNYENHPVAAVVVIGPAHRVNIKNNRRVCDLAKQTAREISSALMQP